MKVENRLEPPQKNSLQNIHIYDRIFCNAEAYRSGHNEAVLKTVWVQAHGGSNPSASARQILNRTLQFGLGFFIDKINCFCYYLSIPFYRRFACLLV